MSACQLIESKELPETGTPLLWCACGRAEANLVVFHHSLPEGFVGGYWV